MYVSKLRYTALIAAVLVIALFTPSQAQQFCQTGCNPTTNPFVVQDIAIPVGPDCIMTVRIRKRICAGVHELEVVSATTTGQCAGINATNSLSVALRILVGNNYMNFPPQGAGPAGTWTWRIAKPACWTSPTPTQLIPCNSPCCVSVLTVTRREGCDTWAISNESFSSVRPTCELTHQSGSGGDGPPNPELCTYSCDPQLPKK